MKFTMSWLEEHLETDASLEQIAKALTQLGLEVESVDDKAYLTPLIIAKIIEAAPHPNADKLKLLKVDIGTGEPLQIVCGAPNARASLLSVLAPIGTFLPQLDITIQKGKIRGETSYGMMCSAAELGLKAENDGIIELPENAPIGGSYATYAKLNDPVIEISITPDRADCTNVHGIARDLAAFGLGTLNEIEPSKSYAPFYEIHDVQNQPSPDYIQQRLKENDIQPENIIIDCCNYIALDIGVPIIALNADELNELPEIKSLDEEADFTTPDGRKYKLPLNTPVLKNRDSGEIEAVGGVTASIKHVFKPGMNNILLYSDAWSEQAVAIAGRHLGINNEQRYRAERGIDQELIPHAWQLVDDILHVRGKAVGKPEDPCPSSMAFDPSLVKDLTSLKIADETIYKILHKLGCVREVGNLIKIPSWRHDLHRPVDLVGEIIRIHGLDELKPEPLPPAEPRKHESRPAVLAKHLPLSHLVKHGLAACGFSEILTWSFISHAQAKAFGGGTEELQLFNPIAANMSDMRPSLLPGLISTAVSNAAKGHKDLSLFELSHIYKDKQELSVAAIRQNQAKFGQQTRHWRGNAGFVDVFDAKQDAMTLLDLAGIKIKNLCFERGAPSFYHPGRSGLIKLGPNLLGHFGELHPDICELFDVKHPLTMFELNLEAAAKLASHKKNGAYLPQLQQNIYRDLVFVAPDAMPAKNLQAIALKADELITKINVFDVFTGAPIEPGMKSVGLELTISPPQPLNAEQIDNICTKVIEAIHGQTGAELRS